MSLKDELFAEICDAKFERLPFVIPTAKGPVTVYAEETNQESIEAWRMEIAKHGGDPDAGEYDIAGQARLIVRCVVDAEGKLIWDVSDAERLAKGRARYIDALYDLCCKVNGLGSHSLALKKS